MRIFASCAERADAAIRRITLVKYPVASVSEYTQSDQQRRKWALNAPAPAMDATSNVGFIVCPVDRSVKGVRTLSPRSARPLKPRMSNCDLNGEMPAVVRMRSSTLRQASAVLFLWCRTRQLDHSLSD